MSRGRALRTGIAYDQRTGFRVRGTQLVSDGEMPGLWVSKENADHLNPQRYPIVPPPDGVNYRPGPPAMHKIGADVDLGWSMGSDSHPPEGDTMQPGSVLTKSYLAGAMLVSPGDIDTPA